MKASEANAWCQSAGNFKGEMTADITEETGRIGVPVVSHEEHDWA